MWREWGIYQEKNHDKTNNTYKYNGNHLQFFSIGIGEGGIERIKSSQWNLIICEEITDFAKTDVLQLKIRLRSPKPKGWARNKLIGACNPIDENHWVLNQEEDPGNREVNHSTYHDNPHLDEDYLRVLEGLINEDPNYYRIYVLGLPGKLENVIYSNWSEVPELPPRGQWQTWCYGLDFGWGRTSLMQIVFTKDGSVYWHNLIHQAKLTNSLLIEKLTHFEKADIYADSEAPDKIEEIKGAGYNCIPVEKGKGSVAAGIDIVARQSLKITASSESTLKEIKGYARKKDRLTGVVLEEPIKFNDHDMDAGRYGTVGMVKRFGYATANPGARGYGRRRIPA